MGRAYGSVYSGSNTAVGPLFTMDVGDLDAVGVQVTLPGTSCTITYEGCNEAVPVNWRGITGVDPYSQSPGLIGTSNIAGYTLFPVQGVKWFRARVSTYGSGTVTAVAIPSDQAAPARNINVNGPNGATFGTGALTPTSGYLPIGGTDGSIGRVLVTDSNGTLFTSGRLISGTSPSGNGLMVGGSDGTNYRNFSTTSTGKLVIDGTLTAGTGIGTTGVIVGGSDGTNFRHMRVDTGGNVAVAYGGGTFPVSGLAASSANGASLTKSISSASTNATSLKASAGRIVGGSVSNLTAAFKFLKLYNKATAPTVGTDTPAWVIPIPPNSTIGLHDLIGLIGAYFGIGIAYAITGGVADTDATAVALNDVVLNLNYA